jgi:hypothetical protein
MRKLILFVLAASAALAADNVLAPEEKATGWVLLFDGETMRGWRDPARENPPGDSWVIESGCLKTRLRPRIAEDLVSEQSYGDFDLCFDWRVSPGGNSGVKYRIQSLIFVDSTKAQPGAFEAVIAREFSNPASDRATLAPTASAQEYSVAFEMQLLDDERHPDAKNGPQYRTGALYSMIAPAAPAARPAGEWNTGRIVVKGARIEHWVNGVKVLEGSLADDAVRQGAAKRWGQYPDILRMFTNPRPTGRISLQHHGDEVWFRNLKIRRL